MYSVLSNPKFSALDSNGVPLAGGKLYTYTAGTTTPKASYTDSTLGTPNANPVILNSRGEADVWLGSGPYKLILKGSDDVTIWTLDQVGWTATATTPGMVELATQAETTTGTDTGRVVTPATLKGVTDALIVPATETVAGIAELATTAEMKAGTDTTRIATPAGVNATMGRGFSAHKNGVDQTGISPSSFTLVTFTTEESDTDSWFDTATSKFQPTVAGVYAVTLAIFFSTNSVANEVHTAAIYKNGSVYKQGSIRPSTSNGERADVTAFVSMNGTTDYIQAYGFAGGAGDKTISGLTNITYFQAYRV